MGYPRKKTSSNYVNRQFMSEDCVINSAIETFEGRWTVQILFCIRSKINRFSLIKKRLPKISDHVLGLRLNHLSDHMLIVKTRTETEITYALSKKGSELIPILEKLTNWHSKY